MRYGGKNPMDQRIESFLADVLALAGEDPDAIREKVRVALAKMLGTRINCAASAFPLTDLTAGAAAPALRPQERPAGRR
jgi:hypothetical protein